MAKYKIPTHDPYTGEPNPHYEELTGKSIAESLHKVKLKNIKIYKNFWFILFLSWIILSQY